jgi:hypothetical protein
MSEPGGDPHKLHKPQVAEDASDEEDDDDDDDDDDDQKKLKSSLSCDHEGSSLRRVASSLPIMDVPSFLSLYNESETRANEQKYKPHYKRFHLFCQEELNGRDTHIPYSLRATNDGKVGLQLIKKDCTPDVLTCRRALFQSCETILLVTH